jgi:hypothetical protein
MGLPWKAPLALAIVLGTTVWAGWAITNPSPLPPDQPLLRYRVGDHFIYELQGSSPPALVEAYVKAPRLVPAPNLTNVLGLPFFVRAVGSSTGFDAFVTDIQHGGLALETDACLLDSTVGSWPTVRFRVGQAGLERSRPGL